MFEELEGVKLPTISTTNTSGLTNIMQLTDNTQNEVFAFKDSTSGTEIIQVLPQPVEEHKK